MADLNTMLLMQYLGNAGAAMSEGKPVGSALNQVTQQSISSQNYMKLLQKMLGGEVPAGGKLTMDEKGMKLDVPKTALGSLSEGGTGVKGSNALIPPTPQPTQNMDQVGFNSFNPFSVASRV